MPVEELGEIVTSLEGLPVPAILTELHARKLIAANASAAGIFGSPVSDLIGQTCCPSSTPPIANLPRWRMPRWPTRRSTATRCDAGS